MTRFENLRARRTNPLRPLLVREAYEDLQENEDVRYLFGAMEPLDAEYTRFTLEEAARVYSYFESISTIRIQGSVKTNTHIRYHSDIDILTITNVFETWEGPLPSHLTRSSVDPISILRTLRADAKAIISSRFPAVEIKERDRALRLSGGSLKRNMDVVAANWYNTLDYERARQERDRGVQILDNAKGNRVINKPFLHEYHINAKIASTQDGAGRAIRLLKTLKADANREIEVSSYDIAALIWNMDGSRLHGDTGASFQTASNVADFLLDQITNEGAKLKQLFVPNGTRRIIDPEGTTVAAVLALWYELHQLLEAIKKAGREIHRRYIVEQRVLRPVA